MDPGWDHTENEDKHLLTQTLLMPTINDTQVAITSPNTTYGVSGGGGCISGYELVSLSGEYTKHLLSVVINNYNLLFGLSPAPFKFPLLFLYTHQLNCLYSCISKIYNFCNSKCQCKCDCKCVTKCNGKTICLCECTKGKKTNGCCICICKHKSCKCVCICICICNKPGQDCCCKTGTHECEKCLVKVDIQSLLCDTWTILCDLRWIKCYISKLENQFCSSPPVGTCCCCSCCVNGHCNRGSCESYCCCKTGEINYSSIITKISIVVILFKEVGKKILELTKMNKTISLYCNKKKLEGCDCCNCEANTKSLTENIEKAGQYYSSFASVIGDIKMLVDYKTFCPQSNEIIEKLKMSVKPLLNQLSITNNDLLNNISTNNTSVLQINKLSMSVYSHYCIFQCFLGLYILLQSSSISYSVLNVLKTPNDCECAKCFDKENKNIEKFSIKTFEEHISSGSDFQKLIVNKEGNHVCLCLVVKHVLYPSLIKSMYLLRYIYLDALSKQTKEFIPGMFTGIEINDATKLVYLIIIFLDKITLWMKAKYPYAWIGWSRGVVIKCFCMYSDDPYYPYLISIILFVSSLIENIWTMDTQSVRMSIEKISSLLSEYQSLHVYTNYGSKKSTRDTTGSKGLENLKSFSINLAQYTKKISIKTTSKNGTCNSGSTGNGESSIGLHIQINKSQTMLVNKTAKAFFKTVLSSLSILIATPLFGLVYSNISGLAFYLIEKGNIIGVSSFLRRGLMGISIKYLNEMCKKEKECNCQEKNGCKICLVGKVVSLGLSITMRKIQVVLSNVSGDMLLNYLKGSINMSEDFITNLCVGFGEVYAIMLKNTKLAHRDTHLNPNSSYKGVKDASSANWGYDSIYEHSITTDNSYSDISPKITKIILKIGH